MLHGVVADAPFFARAGKNDFLSPARAGKSDFLSPITSPWVGGHGGVYVRVSDQVKPLPLPSNLPDRDAETPSGKKLTLLNSPALLREMFHEFEGSGGGG